MACDSILQQEVVITVGDDNLYALLAVPGDVRGVIVFVHGIDRRGSLRNGYAARAFHKAGFATLLPELMTAGERRLDWCTRDVRFCVDFLANRLVAVTQWVGEQPDMGDLPIGYFGTNIGTAAALIAASRLPQTVQAVVSIDGRPGLADDSLPYVQCPTLLIAGGSDRQTVALHFDAIDKLTVINKRLHVIIGAGPDFEDLDTHKKIAATACDWFSRNLRRPVAKRPCRAMTLVGAEA